MASPVANQLGSPKPKQSSAASTSDELVHQNVEAALRRLFSNSTYVPLDPFKSVLFSLRRKERSQDLATRQSALPSTIIRQITSAAIPLVKFGASAGVGFKHLAKLLSVGAIRRLCTVLDGLRHALGSFPLKLIKPTSTSDFIETATINSCFAGNVATPRPHLIETVVEAVIEAKDLDAALDIFIRRVVDEGFAAERSSAIVSAHINVLLSGRSAHVTPFRVSEIHAQTRQVQSAMKSAVVDNGAIYLELFFRVCRVLPSFTPGSEYEELAEPSMGFVKIVRKYHFSYKDPHTGQCRCFAKYPFETLARNMFFNMDQAKAYRACYDSHCGRMVLADPDDPREALMDNVLVNLARQAWGALAEGELVVAAEWLLQLAAILFPSELRCNAAVTPATLLLTRTTGMLRAARDSCLGLKVLLTIISNSIKEHSELLQRYYTSNGGGITRELVEGPGGQEEYVIVYFRPGCTVEKEEERDVIKSLHSQYATVSHAIMEVRNVLLSLLREGRSSELVYLSDYILKQLHRLFDPYDRVTPIIPSDPFILSKKSGLLGVTVYLEDAAAPLHQLSTCLHMLELSVGTDVLFELLEREHGADPGVAVGRSLPDRSASGKAINPAAATSKGSSKTGSSDHEHDQHMPSIPINWVPLNLSELLGYAKTLSRHKHTALSSTVLWNPLHTTELLRPFITPAASHRHVSLSRTAVASSVLYQTEDAGLFTGYTPSGLDGTSPHTGVPTCWDLCAQLNQNSLSRFGCVDIPTAMREEDTRYDIPRFMSRDGIRMRYLMETHLYRALHEALVQVRLQPKAISPYAVISSHLFPFSSSLQLWRVGDEILLYNIYAAQSLGLVRVFKNCSHVSKLLVPGLNTPKDIKSHTALHQQQRHASTTSPLLFGSTGIYGPASVVSGLGGYLLPAGFSNDDSNDYITSTIKPKNRNVIYSDISMAAKLYKFAWSIPPLLSAPPPSRPGLKLEVCSGLSVATAVSWGWNWNCSDSRYKILDPNANDEAPPSVKKRSWLSRIWNRETEEAPQSQIAQPVVADPDAPPPQSSFFTSPYNDIGVLDYPGEIELEIVYSASYNHPDLVSSVRALFAEQVIKCIKQLTKQPLWRLFGLTIAERHYPINYVASADTEALVAGMLKALTKHGIGSLIGAVALPDLITEDILGEKTSADDINDEASIRRKQALNRAHNQRLVSLDKVLNVLREVSLEKQNASADAADMDPCYDDLSRIVSDSSGSAAMATPVQRVQDDSSDRFTAGAAAGGGVGTGTGAAGAFATIHEAQPAIRCYVPFKITFSLIGICTQAVKVVRKNILKKRNHIGNLSIGGRTLSERANYARLLTATLWFSTSAAHSIWDGLKCWNYKGRDDVRASDVDADAMFNLEATRQWRLFRQLQHVDMIASYTHAAVYILIANQPQYAATLCRVLNSLAAQLQKTMACIDTVTEILSRDSFPSVNQRALGHTIVRHVCLAMRLIITSPRCVHLVGGGYLVLKDLEQLELVLGLGKIPLCEAGYVPTPHQPGHEKTPHSAWGHSSAKHAANRGLGVTLPVATPVPGAKATAVDLQVISGETALSRKLEIRENVTAALAILANLRGACTVLFEALCKDVKATGEDNLAGLLSLAPDTDTHPFLIHHTSDVPPPRAASTATDAAAPTVMTVAESLAQELQQEQQSKLRQPLQPEPQTLYVSRRALREQAARKKRPLVRMNINATSSAVVHGATVEQQLHPFRLIQKITDIATKIKKTEMAEVEGPPVEPDAEAEREDGNGETEGDLLGIVIEGAREAESRAGTAMYDDSLGPGPSLDGGGSVSSLGSVGTGLDIGLGVGAGIPEEGESSSSDTDEEVHVGMMFKRKFDARRAEADRWSNLIKNARGAQERTNYEDGEEVSTPGGGSSDIRAMSALSGVSTGAGEAAGGSAEQGSGLGSAGLGGGSLFKSKFKNKMGVLRGLRSAGSASGGDRRNSASQAEEEYVVPPVLHVGGKSWLVRQREAAAAEEEDLELFLHGGSVNLPPPAAEPAPAPAPTGFQNHPDAIGFRIDDAVTAQYNRWASRADEFDFQHVHDGDDDNDDGDGDMEGGEGSAGAGRRHGSRVERDERGQVVHARARPPSMLKLLRLQTEYTNNVAQGQGMQVSPMPGSEGNLFDLGGSEYGGGGSGGQQRRYSSQQPPPYDNKVNSNYGYGGGSVVESIATAGTRDRSIQFFDQEANRGAAQTAVINNSKQPLAGVLHTDYQKFAAMARVQAQLAAGRHPPTANGAGLYTDDSVAVLDNLRNPADYKG